MWALRTLQAALDWRAIAVVVRNGRVYQRNWRTSFLPPAMEPIIFFVAFGIGLGGYVGNMQHDDQTISYATYVAPGLLAYTAFGTPFFEALYGSYVRMSFQKTWDGILATQVELEHIVWGEILWSGVRGFMNCSVVALVLLGFSLAGWIDIDLRFLALLPFIAGAAGWAFAAFGLIFTALVPAIDHMNYPSFLVGIPLGMMSNTYFPVTSDNGIVATLIALNPVYHLSETFRDALVLGRISEHALWLLLTAGGCLVICSLIAQRLTRRRVLGE